MPTWIKLIVLIVCTNLLAGCNTTKRAADYDKQNVKTAKINAQLGIIYLEEHNIPRAKQKLLLALDEAPSIPEPWYSMAYFYETTGNNVLAEQYYQKAIKLAPKRGDSQNNYGTFLCRTGKYKASIEHFDRAVSDKDYLSPADAYENAGLCALKIPNKKLAMEYFKRAVMEDPSRSVALKKLAQLEIEADGA